MVLVGGGGGNFARADFRLCSSGNVYLWKTFPWNLLFSSQEPLPLSSILSLLSPLRRGPKAPGGMSGFSDPRFRRNGSESKQGRPLRIDGKSAGVRGEERVDMNKSIVLGLLLAMMVPAVALADGVSFSGDLRLRWDYASLDLPGSVDDDSFNNTDAVLNIGISGTVSDNVGVTASLRHALAFGLDGDGPDNDGALNIQEVFVSIGNLGAATSVMDGWSLDVGRMELPDYGRIIHSDDWFSALPPFNADGYHLASDLGGVGVDIYHYASGASPAGDSDAITGFNADMGDLGGFADIAFGYWIANPSHSTGGDNNTWFSVTADNLGGENVAGLDIDFGYASVDPGDDGDSGTLTSVSVGYDMETVNLHVSNSVTEDTWFNMVGIEPHGTHGITDLFMFANDIDNTTVGASFSLMDSVDATVNYITLGQDSTGDDIGTEIDLILAWDCGDDVAMNIGYGMFSGDDDFGGGDYDYVYIQTGWSF